ncbi:hypothetical protein D9M69_489500 [compost metagenome]
MLDAFVVRLYIAPAPAWIAELVPAVEVHRKPAAVDHRVDRTGAADHPAARPVAAALLGGRVRFGCVLPVDPLVVKGPAVADRYLDPEAPVAATRLEHQHGGVPLAGKPVRQNRTRRPAADDDVVELPY